MVKISRGIRNNNPANIRRSATKWAFLKPVQSDKSFCQFIDIRYGIRAFFILMRTYRYKYGLKEVGKILRRFAPPSENDLVSYQAFLTKHFLTSDLELRSDSGYCILAKYIFKYESGFECTTDYLKLIMREQNCFVINPQKECYEADLF